MQRLSYRILVSCLLGINFVNASHVATTSPFPTISPAVDPSSTPLSSPNSNTLDAYCSNTLDLVEHDDNTSCEDDSVSCSSDPIVLANCCRCKPMCCNHCSTPSSNPEDSGICSKTTTTTTEIEDDKEEKKKKLTGMIGYGLGILILAICAVHQSQQPSSLRQQQKRRKRVPTKFYIATIPSADGKGKDAGVANIQSLFKDQKGTLEMPSDGVVEDQDTQTRVDISLDDIRHERGDNNMTSSKRATGDIEDQGGETMYDVPLGNSISNPDDDRLSETSSEMTRSVNSDGAEEEEDQKALHGGDDDDNDVVVVVVVNGKTGSLSERTTSAEAECPICLEPYRPGDTICVSKSPHCEHIFHRECISEWISEHNLCPLCRVDLMKAKSKK
eukprot:scaffold5452_cov71-Cylindrotheca_fusiformis.AAC.1